MSRDVSVYLASHYPFQMAFMPYPCRERYLDQIDASISDKGVQVAEQRLL
jgi:hypothetical protein